MNLFPSSVTFFKVMKMLQNVCLFSGCMSYVQTGTSKDLFSNLIPWHIFWTNFSNAIPVVDYFNTRYTLAIIPQPQCPPQPLYQPLMHFLAIQCCLIGTFHISGITQCMIFCDWLFSLNTMFSRFKFHLCGSMYLHIIPSLIRFYSNTYFFL